MLDVFDNLDLSSSSSSEDEAEFRPTGSRIQIGRIKPPAAPPPAAEVPPRPVPYLLRGCAEAAKPSQQKAICDSAGAIAAAATEKVVGTKRAFAFLKANRPPSRHKTPPKALGLDLPETPHTPPKTQKELEEYKEYSHTINLKGINLLNKEPSSSGFQGRKPFEAEFDSDSDSFSSSTRLFFCWGA